MVTVEFPSGHTLTGKSFDDVLRKWNRKRWTKRMSPSEFRREVARRAIVWSGQPEVNPADEAEAFLRGCERARLLRIISE